MFKKKLYRIKQKGRRLYVRWITDPNQAIFTDLVDEAILFDRGAAKAVIKALKMFASWLDFEMEGVR